jgi:hypothetical protein
MGLGLAAFGDDLADEGFGVFGRTAVVDSDVGPFGGEA